MMGKALSCELSCPCDRSCLARLYDYRKSYHTIPGVCIGGGSSGVSKMLKFLHLSFLCDGQGTDRLAILSGRGLIKSQV